MVSNLALLFALIIGFKNMNLFLRIFSVLIHAILFVMITGVISLVMLANSMVEALFYKIFIFKCSSNSLLFTKIDVVSIRKISMITYK